MLHPDLDSLKTILYRAIQEVAWCKVSIVEEDIKIDVTSKCSDNGDMFRACTWTRVCT